MQMFSNSPTGPLISCSINGRRVTIPEPRGKKSLWKSVKTREKKLVVLEILRILKIEVNAVSKTQIKATNLRENISENPRHPIPINRWKNLVGWNLRDH